MNVKDLYKLSEKDKERFIAKENNIISNAQKFDLYEDYISSQKKPFLDFMNFLNSYINELKSRGEISDYVEFRARIKSATSAINNDSKKALDDAFGMELICATEEEINYLLEKLYEFMNVTKSKSHNKENGYKAEHRYLTLKNNYYNLLYPDNIDEELLPQVPIIEFQLKTIEVSIKSNEGSASHTLYKCDKKEDIQQMYDNGKLQVGSTLPRMWCSINGEMILLSDEQTAKKLYPFLDITHSKEKDISD